MSSVTLFAMRWIHVSAEPNSRHAGTLRLENLSVTFATRAGTVYAVKDLCLTIEAGECLGVVGESGAGKSQAFLAALGLLAANGKATGRAWFGHADLIAMRSAELDTVRGAQIGTVFQDPMTSLTPHMRIGDQIAEPLVRHNGLGWREARARAVELLNQVHLTDAARRMRQYPHELSGGMRQRVMIAIALACEPALLIADEPTTALDVTIQAQILALLAELKRSRGMSMVLITHDLGAVAGLADRVAVMRAGEVVELDSVGGIFKAPRHAYTRALLKAVPRLEDGVPRSADTRGRAADPQRVAPVPVAPLSVAPVALAARVSGAAPPSGVSPVPGGTDSGVDRGHDARLVLDDVRVQFNIRAGWLGGAKPLRAVDGVSLELRAGEAIGVVGESGSGKSTLARAALQLIRTQSGRVAWLGRPVQGLSQRELKPLRRDIQIIFQDPLASLDPRMTAGEIVSEPLQLHLPDLDADGRTRAVSESLARVGLSPELADRYPHELSGGQCQRVGIARAMVLQPRLLICDEPVSALDVTVQEQIVDLLADLKRHTGLSLLFISHNLAVVRKLCDRILVLYLGRMMELAPAAAIYSRPLHPYTRELLESAPVPDPDVQPGRLARALLGEPPSPLSPPGGCVYRTRCPHAIDVCRERVPEWETAQSDSPGDASRAVACHRWRELASHFEVTK
jgi:oligopeptide/dipeptide ABC transporter ATP-binding protein